MTIDYQRLRIEGVYKQNDEGHLMLRVKVPAGVLSAEQALKVAAIAERFANGDRAPDHPRQHRNPLAAVSPIWPRRLRLLAAVGLTSRGACGGAVRGVACSTTFGEGFAVTRPWPASCTATSPATPISRGCRKNSRSASMPATAAPGI